MQAAKVKISKRSVDALRPADKPFTVYDTEIPAFAVDVRPSGMKVYRLWYRHAGTLRKLTIGRHGSITADEARGLAKDALFAVHEGRDPANEKQRKRAEATFSELFEEWLSVHIDPKRKPATRTEYRRIYEVELKRALGRRPLAEITRADVSRLHARRADVPYTANRIVAVLRSFFTWTERQGIRPLGSNPARLIERYRETARERFLTADEFSRIGAALREAEAAGEWPWAIAAVRLLLLTGARRGEVLALRWDRVDLQAGTARLADSKTGAKTIYLGSAARDVLASVKRLPDNPHVICGRARGGALIGLPRFWRRIRKRAGVDDVRIHDLRHAFSSAGAMGGLPLLTLGRLLGHSQPSVTDRYSHFASSPLVAAADAISAAIATQLGAADGGDNGQA